MGSLFGNILKKIKKTKFYNGLLFLLYIKFLPNIENVQNRKAEISTTHTLADISIDDIEVILLKNKKRNELIKIQI